jgi:hypothetical protein
MTRILMGLWSPTLVRIENEFAALDHVGRARLCEIYERSMGIFIIVASV